MPMTAARRGVVDGYEGGDAACRSVTASAGVLVELPAALRSQQKAPATLLPVTFSDGGLSAGGYPIVRNLGGSLFHNTEAAAPATGMVLGAVASDGMATATDDLAVGRLACNRCESRLHGISWLIFAPVPCMVADRCTRVQIPGMREDQDLLDDARVGMQRKGLASRDAVPPAAAVPQRALCNPPATDRFWQVQGHASAT